LIYKNPHSYIKNKGREQMLHLGIIGCGRVTSMFHLKALKHMDNIEVTAVSDINTKRLMQIGNKCGAKNFYTDYKQLILDKKIDAVVVNTPPIIHERIVIKSLKGGKHVICEKPLSQTVEGCNKIREYKKKTGLTVLPAHNYIFSPSMIMMEKLIAEKKIGRIISLNLSFENNLRTYRSKTNFRETLQYGIIEDVLPHILSITIPFIGKTSSVETVDSWCKSYDVYDNVKIVFSAGSNIPVSANISWTKIIPNFSVLIKGEKGTISSDLMLEPFKVKTVIDGKTRTLKEKGMSWYFDLLRLKHPSFRNLYHHFLQIIEKNSAPRFTIEDEINIIKTIGEVSSFLEK
jgi:predicted dehydrogenase